MPKTLLPTEQITVQSSKTGQFILDAWIESLEKGNRTVPDLLDDLFDETGALKIEPEMRVVDGVLQYRVGIYGLPEEGWIPLIDYRGTQGDYVSGSTYQAGQMLFHQNGVVYVMNDVASAPANLNPDTDPNIKWFIDGNRVSAILQAAETFRDEAEAAKIASQTAQSAAEFAQGETENARDIAVAAEANVTTIQTDITTKHSETITAKTEAEAAESQAKIYRDETEVFKNTVTDQLIFKGLWDIAANGYPPTPDGAPEKNVYYRLTSTGYVGGEQVHSGYEMAYDYANATWYVIGTTFDPDDYVPKSGGNFTSKIDFDAGIQTQSVKVNDFSDSQNPASFWQFHAWGDDFQITSRESDGSYKATNFQFSWTDPNEARVNGNRIYHSGYTNGLVTDSGSQYIDGPKTFFNDDISGTASTAPIRIRERNQVGNAQSDLAYAPSLSFYWNGCHTKQLQMDFNGDLLWEGDKIQIDNSEHIYIYQNNAISTGYSSMTYGYSGYPHYRSLFFYQDKIISSSYDGGTIKLFNSNLVTGALGNFAIMGGYTGNGGHANNVVISVTYDPKNNRFVGITSYRPAQISHLVVLDSSIVGSGANNATSIVLSSVSAYADTTTIPSQIYIHPTTGNLVVGYVHYQSLLLTAIREYDIDTFALLNTITIPTSGSIGGVSVTTHTPWAFDEDGELWLMVNKNRLVKVDTATLEAKTLAQLIGLDSGTAYSTGSFDQMFFAGRTLNLMYSANGFATLSPVRLK